MRTRTRGISRKVRSWMAPLSVVSRSAHSRSQQSSQRPSLRLEALEERWVPAANITNYRYNLQYTGANLGESSLTPANVNANSFGRLAQVDLDGQMFAQPLYVSDVRITTGPLAGRVRNVVYAATQHNSVYAIDGQTGTVLWRSNFLDEEGGITTINPFQVVMADFDEIGITGTPVIDLASQTLYVVARTAEYDAQADVLHYVARLHALDLGNGAEKFGGPALIADTSVANPPENIDDWYNPGYFQYNFHYGPTVVGSGDDQDVNGPDNIVHFNAMRQLQRSALTLHEGTVYIAWASHSEFRPYHGWILGFDASTLELNAVFNVTPNGYGGGIWGSGAGLVVDPQGSLYVSPGYDGIFDGEIDEDGNIIGIDANGFPIQRNFADSVLKLERDSSTPNNQNGNGWGLRVIDYFHSSNVFVESFGSAGILILPDEVGSAQHPHLLLAQGKAAGIIYLLDRNNLGKFNTEDGQAQVVLQEIVGVAGRVYSTPTYFEGFVYYAGVNNTLKQFRIANARMELVRDTGVQYSYPGANLAVSANGSTSGVLWSMDKSFWELRAFNAVTLERLYTSPEGELEYVTTFSVPVVADGRVYIGTYTSLYIFGTAAAFEPLGLSAVVRPGNEVELRWDAQGSVENFILEISVEGGEYSILADSIPGTARTIRIGDLSPGARYSFRLWATNASGSSPYSNEVTIATAPLAPSDLTVEVFRGLVRLTWLNNAPEDTYTGIFIVRRHNGGNLVELGFLPPGENTFEDDTALPGQFYAYSVYAVVDEVASERSNEVTLALPALPSGVANFQATSSSTSVILSWVNISGALASGFEIYVVLPGGELDLLAILPAGARSFVVTDLLPSTSYLFAIYAFNGAGYSDVAFTDAVTLAEGGPGGGAAPVPGPGTSDEDIVFAPLTSHSVDRSYRRGSRVGRIDSLFVALLSRRQRPIGAIGPVVDL